MMFVAMLALTAVEPNVVAAEKDPVVCARQTVGSEVGTHMRPKKVCMKKSEWELVEAHTKETLQSINGRGNNPGKADGHALNPE
jgi:hypothetical protein